MTRGELTAADLEQLGRRGIAPAEVERQLELFRHPPRSQRLLRPCLLGDGIVRLERARRAELLERSSRAAAAGRLLAFIPASGAASRMFEGLLGLLQEEPSATLFDLERRAGAGERPAADVLRLWAHLGEFAFQQELAAAMRDAGLDLEAARAAGDHVAVLRALLVEPGLGYAERPKALIPFHRAAGGARTPLVEQLFEAVEYLADAGGVVRLHFTVTPEHEPSFREHLARAAAGLAADRSVRLEVVLSRQDPATDTLAVDVYNRPVRTADGALFFRPGGHGALLANLQATGGDIVFIKNIDNVVPDRRKPLTVRWKRLLAGHLLELEEATRAHLERLAETNPDPAALAAAERFAAEELGRRPAPAPADERAARLRRLLDRPLRVCGMVPNQGQPGGGPFWVVDRAGEVSRQIVEASQVDDESEEQRSIWQASTHFNPVDLVCGLRDRHGRPYPLERFVDPDAVFISTKSANGQRLRALERPGLWNGAMAGWNTVFVEVPAETFAPVKTLLDLLRPEHVC
jgi:hypothetical protein